MKEITFKIPNISCHHCLRTIEREAGLVAGVRFVQGSPEAKTATFEVADDAALTALQQALAEAGYPPAL